MKKLLCMLCMCVLSLSAVAQEQGKGGFWDKCFAEMSIGTGISSHHVTPISGGINVGVNLSERFYLYAGGEGIRGLYEKDEVKTHYKSNALGGGVGFTFARDDKRQMAWDIRAGVKTSIGNPSWKQTTYDISVIWKNAGKKHRPKAFIGLGFRYMDSHADGIPNLSMLYATVGWYL